MLNLFGLTATQLRFLALLGWGDNGKQSIHLKNINKIFFENKKIKKKLFSFPLFKIYKKNLKFSSRRLLYIVLVSIVLSIVSYQICHSSYQICPKCHSTLSKNHIKFGIDT